MKKTFLNRTVKYFYLLCLKYLVRKDYFNNKFIKL